MSEALAKPDAAVSVEPEETPAERELREATVKMRAQREARDVATREARAKAELAAVLVRTESEETVARFEDELGAAEIKHVFFEKGVAIVKRPTHAHFVKHQNAGKDDYQAHMAYVQPCLVHPKIDVFEAWLKREPFKLTSVAGCVSILAGVVVQDTLAK